MRDVLFVNLVLLCGDVLQNPGPVRIQCFNCHKTIRKNQGRADCSDCLQSYHLKCLGVDFETSKKCFLCSVKGMDSGGESGVECTNFNIATELHEAIKLRGLKFIHQYTQYSWKTRRIKYSNITVSKFTYSGLYRDVA